MAKTLIWVVLGAMVLVFAGWFVVSLLGTLLKLGFYLLIGAVVVGGGYVLVTKARAAVRGGRFRQLP